jgi:endonuclease I
MVTSNGINNNFKRSKLGTSAVSGYTGTVLNQRRLLKDIARMYFYFATRYENTVAGYPLCLMVAATKYSTAF